MFLSRSSVPNLEDIRSKRDHIWKTQWKLAAFYAQLPRFDVEISHESFVMKFLKSIPNLKKTGTNGMRRCVVDHHRTESRSGRGGDCLPKICMKSKSSQTLFILKEPLSMLHWFFILGDLKFYNF